MARVDQDILNGRLLLLVVAMLGACLIVMIIWAARSSGIGDGMRYMLSDRWGVVTLVDLLAGLVLVGFWIAWLEPVWWRRVCWWLGLLCLGNLTSVVFVAFRLWRYGSVSRALFTRDPAESDS